VVIFQGDITNKSALIPYLLHPSYIPSPSQFPRWPV